MNYFSMTMVNKSDILAILKTNYEVLSNQFHVSQIGLFGSFAKEFESESSDIDLLVEFSKPITLFQFIELEDYLTEKLGRQVDLVSKKGLKPLLKSRILKDVVYV